MAAVRYPTHSLCTLLSLILPILTSMYLYHKKKRGCTHLGRDPMCLCLPPSGGMVQSGDSEVDTVVKLFGIDQGRTLRCTSGRFLTGERRVVSVWLGRFRTIIIRVSSSERRAGLLASA
ncbi:hypothetical protein FN846DRAFT_933287 [Sphaerosporella brunnea]|uniref:Uncharacterized protein n=1 Tax=Sphaerosporella brunnea TaxID=1250544 RepID=A0A5J5F729_9PEZI|nr:hypothetical protein FN846DRAFT_933287 [Sphaerosporella brunnea]